MDISQINSFEWTTPTLTLKTLPLRLGSLDFQSRDSDLFAANATRKRGIEDRTDLTIVLLQI